MGESSDEVRRGAAVYGKRVLGLYDVFVVYFSNTFVWRCSRRRMLELYRNGVGPRHLDVGPGTGWYLANASIPTDANVTLMDLNANSLAAARRTLAGRDPRAVVGNVLEPLPSELEEFDSIAVNYLFHCVPGSWEDKGHAFGHLSDRLAATGTVFGATILGRGVRHNWLGRRLMAVYNRKGIFHNTQDDVEGLKQALGRHFTDVNVDVVGTVALFEASGPRG